MSSTARPAICARSCRRSSATSTRARARMCVSVQPIKSSSSTCRATMVEFSYKDGTGYHFMDPETYETVTLNDNLLGDAKEYLVENLRVEVLYTEGKAVQVEIAVLGATEGRGSTGRSARRHRFERDEARGARDRQDGQRPALHQRRRVIKIDTAPAPTWAAHSAARGCAL